MCARMPSKFVQAVIADHQLALAGGRMLDRYFGAELLGQPPAPNLIDIGVPREEASRGWLAGERCMRRTRAPYHAYREAPSGTMRAATSTLMLCDWGNGSRARA